MLIKWNFGSKVLCRCIQIFTVVIIKSSVVLLWNWNDNISGTTVKMIIRQSLKSAFDSQIIWQQKCYMYILAKDQGFFLHKYSLEIYSWVKVIYSTFGFLGHMSKFNRIITVDILRLFLSIYFHKILDFFGSILRQPFFIILSISMSKCVLKFVKFVRLKSRCDMHISRGKHNKTMQNPFAEKKIHIISQQFSRILCTT